MDRNRCYSGGHQCRAVGFGGRAACEARSATWNSGYQLSICSRIEENLDRVGRSQGLLDVN
jgi:hypothetical protein